MCAAKCALEWRGFHSDWMICVGGGHARLLRSGLMSLHLRSFAEICRRTDGARSTVVCLVSHGAGRSLGDDLWCCPTNGRPTSSGITQTATHIVDRVTFNAHILEVGIQSYRLRASETGTRGKPAS